MRLLVKIGMRMVLKTVMRMVMRTVIVIWRTVIVIWIVILDSKVFEADTEDKSKRNQLQFLSKFATMLF